MRNGLNEIKHTEKEEKKTTGKIQISFIPHIHTHTDKQPENSERSTNYYRNHHNYDRMHNMVEMLF
jgi:hypothetical protein